MTAGGGETRDQRCGDEAANHDRDRDRAQHVRDLEHGLAQAMSNGGIWHLQVHDLRRVREDGDGTAHSRDEERWGRREVEHAADVDERVRMASLVPGPECDDQQTACQQSQNTC